MIHLPLVFVKKIIFNAAMLRFLHKYKQELLYGVSLAAVLFLLQLLQYKLVLVNHSYEVYILCIALIFTGLGIWLALKLMKPKKEIETIIVEKNVYQKELTEADKAAAELEKQKLGLSTREMEVLQLMAQGLSNQEIADRLFVSLHTVKTHSSKLFEKMDVKRRTQAIEKARQLNIIE
jgi:two-component system, NarL family, response regulator LiaR